MGKKKLPKRQHFTFYRSFYEAISCLESKEEQADLYNAIMELSLNFNDPNDEEKLNKIVWTLIKPNILTSCKNYINGSKPKRSHAVSQSEATTSISISNSNKKEDIKIDTTKNVLTKAKQILDFFNEACGRNYRPVKANLDPIIARLNSGVSQEDIEIVIMHRYNEWHTDVKMKEYLRPETVFRASKFEDYYAKAMVWKEESERRNNK